MRVREVRANNWQSPQQQQQQQRLEHGHEHEQQQQRSAAHMPDGQNIAGASWLVTPITSTMLIIHGDDVVVVVDGDGCR
ncbi:unnamed protein product [Heligmosomoides polygyrus]|uniref:Uncharacterized protein n=1 Tax=Heligmosomoides polygyrus TaxID=6339 RepID=A0A183FN53_HELPZ|nr:unnamed protein product [Heligmosomoides polygyrus]